MLVTLLLANDHLSSGLNLTVSLDTIHLEIRRFRLDRVKYVAGFRHRLKNAWWLLWHGRYWDGRFSLLHKRTKL